MFFITVFCVGMRTETKVPGGIYSDLKSTLGDILYGNRDEDYKWVGLSDWKYDTEFSGI